MCLWGTSERELGKAYFFIKNGTANRAASNAYLTTSYVPIKGLQGLQGWPTARDSG
jgi:hypothetical protein